ASAVLVENDARACGVIFHNLDALGYEAKARLLRAALPGALAQLRGSRFDLVFSDPPYALQAAQAALDALAAEELLAPSARVVLRNPAKDAVFNVEERVELLKGAVNGDRRVVVKTFEGLLVKFAEEQGVNTVLRGLRAVSDFEYEFQMANMNRKLDPTIETLF